jgi:hypothetical protein
VIPAVEGARTFGVVTVFDQRHAKVVWGRVRCVRIGALARRPNADERAGRLLEANV